MSNSSSEQTRVGWIGTGVMGSSMCSHLIEAGYETSIFTRTRDKAAELEAKGARWRDSPRPGRRRFRRHLCDRGVSRRRAPGLPRREFGPRGSTPGQSCRQHDDQPAEPGGRDPRAGQGARVGSIDAPEVMSVTAAGLCR